jgi:Transposase IS116/IS110/IS902 family./Transposase.
MSKIKYVGMDVHKSTIVVVVLDEKGKIICQAIIPTTGEAVRSFIKGLGGIIHLTFEEGTQAAWLYDVLSPLVAELVVCDPRYNKKRYASSKNDKVDARHLAELLRTSALKGVYHGEKSTRALKELSRSYQGLVSDSVRVMNRIKAIYRGRGINCSGTSVYGPLREQWMAKLTDPGRRKRAEFLYSELDHLRELRRQSKELLIKESKKHKALKSLLTVPGLGPVRAAQIIAIIAHPQRFGHKRQLWVYCGLSVLTHSSADHEIRNGIIYRKNKGKTTRGLSWTYNREMKALLKATALDAIKREPFKGIFQKMIDRGLKTEVARVAIARKLASIILCLMKKGESFDPKHLTDQVA